MHTSVFKLVWASLACIQVKFLYLHHKARVLIILAQGFFYWSFHIGCIWLHKGFLVFAILIWVLISIVSPILLSYLNSKVKCMICKFICKFTMLWYVSLSCCNMQVYMQVCHAMICKFIMSCYASLPCYAMQVCHVKICKYVMQVWDDHFVHVIMLCKLILSMWT